MRRPVRTSSSPSGTATGAYCAVFVTCQMQDSHNNVFCYSNVTLGVCIITIANQLIMKKQLLLFFTFSIICFAANAQNQISLLVGPPPEGFDPSYGYYDGYSTGANTLYDLYEPKTWVSGGAVFGLEYSRNLNTRFALGGDFMYGFKNISRTPGSAYEGDTETFHRHMYSTMANVKFNYILDPFFKFYVKVNLGAGVRTGGIEETKIQFDYQLTPIGVEMGRKNRIAIIEMGYGTMFLIRFGLGYKF